MYETLIPTCVAHVKADNFNFPHTIDGTDKCLHETYSYMKELGCVSSVNDLLIG